MLGSFSTKDERKCCSNGASSVNSMSLSTCAKQQSESIKESAVKLGFASSFCPSEMLKRSEDGMWLSVRSQLSHGSEEASKKGVGNRSSHVGIDGLCKLTMRITCGQFDESKWGEKLNTPWIQEPPCRPCSLCPGSKICPAAAAN